jgi:AIPR protein
LAALRRLTVPLVGHLVEAADGLLVGPVSLVDLCNFLKEYRTRTNDLDQLFEKNVQRFLGGKVKVNRGMQSTLRDAPEEFGLFNNGITTVMLPVRDGK